MGLAVSAQFDWLGHFLNPCGKTHIRRKGNALGGTEASLYKNLSRSKDLPETADSTAIEYQHGGSDHVIPQYTTGFTHPDPGTARNQEGCRDRCCCGCADG
ncbi:hypothetical protein METHPM2_890024 [Pseudomonas sp. PM2]